MAFGAGYRIVEQPALLGRISGQLVAPKNEDVVEFAVLRPVCGGQRAAGCAARVCAAGVERALGELPSEIVRDAPEASELCESLDLVADFRGNGFKVAFRPPIQLCEQAVASDSQTSGRAQFSPRNQSGKASGSSSDSFSAKSVIVAMMVKRDSGFGSPP